MVTEKCRHHGIATLVLGVMLCAAVTAEGAQSAQGFTLWDATHTTAEAWTGPAGLSVSVEEGCLIFDITAWDSRIARPKLDINPKRLDTFLIRYRAEGFNGEPTHGEIFYENADHGFDGAHYVTVPSLEADGAWHELIIPVATSLRGAFTDWHDGGAVTALRFDLVNQFPGRIEIGSILLARGLRTVRAEDVEVDAARWYFIPLDSLTPRDGRHTRELRLPEGPLSIWARVLENAQGRELLGKLEVAPGEREEPDLGGSGEHAWVRLGTVEGGEVAVSLEAEPSVCLDALALVEGDGVPKDRPPLEPRPVKSTTEPLEPTEKTILRPYWSGNMMAVPGKRTSPDTTTCFRRAIEVPEDLESAWAQVSVDDQFHLYVNGEEVAANTRGDSWMSPTVVEITGMLKKGETNVVAVEAYNAGGPGGTLVDITMNRADLTHTKVVSDASWACTATKADGWTNADFDDSRWEEPELLPAPPYPPWTTELPYADKTYQAPTELLDITFESTVDTGEAQALSFRFRSDKPVKAGEVLALSLSNEATGKRLVRREFELAKEQCTDVEPGITEVSGISLDLSPWLPAMTLVVDAAIYGRAVSPANPEPTTFRLENAAPEAVLESHVAEMAGTPRLFVNDMLMYPLVGNGEGRGREGCREAFHEAGFNIEAIWIDPMTEDQWWEGPEDYHFEVVDVKVGEGLDYDPDVFILPIIWAAPPPWWGELHPDELSRWSDGGTWSYYKSTMSFSSGQWRQDAAEALTALVKHMESAPYASRVLGYWIIGGVSAEWQGWGTHSCHVHNHLMDYSRPALEGFRAFLDTKYPERAGTFGSVEIPPLEERTRGELGVFRDPAEAQFAIDYTEYYSESIVDAMLHCTRAAKEACGRSKIVGAYFGYSLEYTNMSWALPTSGHNRLRKALDSPDIDFFSAPPSYAVRRPGCDQSWMWPFRAMHGAGKLVWVDDDTRTFLSGVCAYTPAVNPDMTREILRRNFAKAICRQCPIGFLQIKSGHELADPAIAEDIRILKHAGEYALAKGVKRSAEIAVVVDEDSVKYLTYDKERLPSGEIDRDIHWNGDVSFSERKVNTLTGDLVSYQRGRIARIGAPVDYLLFSDLTACEPNYKLYIMLTCFQYDEASLRAVYEKLYAKGATVLWCYAPGFIADGRADVANMARLTAIRLGMIDEPQPLKTNIVDLTNPYCSGLTSPSLGAPYALAPVFYADDPGAIPLGVYAADGRVSLAYKRVGDGVSLFCGSNKLSAEFLHGLALAAGVHVYSDSLDPFEANDNFIMIHSTHAGAKTIRLKQPQDVVDVFAGEILVREAGEVTFDMPAESTRFLFAGKAEAFGAQGKP